MKARFAINYGPKDWEILQQENGVASFDVGGECYLEAEKDCEAAQIEGYRVMARIVFEDTDEPVTEWIEAKHTEDKWNVHFEDVPAGGLYRLTAIIMTNSHSWIEWGMGGLLIHHFGVGDLYVITGQSNAAGIGKGVISEPAELGVHVLRNCEKWDLATNPLYEKRSYHGPAVSFGKKLKSKLHYPIGLIPCAYGGSSLAQWLPDEDGLWFNYMIDVMKVNNIKIKGVLWSHGSTDANGNGAIGYKERFGKFVNAIRDYCKNDKLPIITYQANRWLDDVKENEEKYDNGWDRLREEQRQAAREMSNVYIVPSIDAGKMTDGIHNSKASNIMLGERAAEKVLYEIYGIGMNPAAPDLECAKYVDDKTVELEFSNVADTLMTFHVFAKRLPVMINDDRGVVEIVDYKIDKNILFLNLARETKGNAYVKCQYGRNPFGIIQDMGKQLPVLCFSNVLIKK